MGIATQTSDGLKFSTTYMYVKNSSGTTLAAISSGGNLGIGDSSPQVGLSLYGNGNISRIKIATTSNHQLNIGEWDGSTHRIEGDANRKLLITSYSSDGIHLGGSGSSHVVIKGGKVGINTTGPVAKLDVRGDLIVDATNNNYGGVRIHDDSSGDYNVYLDMGRNQGNTRFHIRNAGRTAGTTTWASGNDVAVFSAAKCWIPQASVGIGTDSPGYKLEVKASVTGNWLSTIYNTATSGNSGGLLVRMDEPGSTGKALGVYANGGYKFTVEPDGEVQILSGAAYTTHLNYQNSGTHYITMANGGATYFRGSSNSITTMTVLGAGSVGIGGTPSAALDLFAANASSVAIRIVGGNKFQFLNASSSTNANIYNSGASGAAELAFQIAGVTKVTIDNSGNVGIGTVSPNVKLHVSSGDIRIGNGNKVYLYESNSVNYLAYNRWEVNTSTALAINNAGTGGFQVQDSGTAVLFVGTDSTYGGKVGISTTSPVEKLDVVGKQRITQNITSNNTYYMLAFGSNRSINDYGGLNKDYWRLNVVTPGSSTTGEGSGHGYGDLRFSSVTGANTTYADRLTIRYNGNVGIGTNVPSAKLHIQSDGSHDEGAEIVLRHANNNTTDVVSTLSFQNSGGQVAMIQAGTTGANNTGYISFFTDSTGTSGERMRIQGNGYVGIGTATAYSPLQVYSSADQKILLSGSANPYIRWQNGGSNRAYIQWVESSNSLSFFNSTGDNFDFYTHDSSVLAIRLKGNDGDNWGYVYAEEGTSQAHAVGFLDGDGAWAARHVKDTSWDFRINNDSKMTINSSGTVAIGGTTLLTNEGMVLNRSGGAGYVAFYDGSGGAKWNIQRNAGVTNCLRIHAYNNTSQVFKVTKNYNSTDGFNILLDSGSVGMGTNYPNKTLEVRYVSTSTDVTAEGLGGGSAGKGLLIYNNNQSNNNVYANLDFRARNADGRIAYQYQTAANVGDFHFITDNTNSPKTQMIIKNDGKVGMGTVTPAARLHVYRPAGTVPGLLVDSNRDGARVNFNYSSSTTTFGEIGMTHYGSSGDCQIWMGANLNSNSSSHSGPAVGVAGTGASSWYTVWNTQTAQDFYGIYRRAPSPSSSYENYFRIKSDGNVGINTTNPTDRLHIRSVQAAGNGSGSNLATLSLETYNSNSDDHGSYVKCKNYGGGGGGPDWKIGGMEGYWTTNKVASIDFVTGDDWYNPGNKDEGEIAFTVYNNTGSGSTAIEAMRIHQTGNIGIGSTNPGSKLTVNGSFSASSKSFLIDHPTKENKKLEHGCLEGPEFGVYHRGTTQSNTITLPDYWSGLVREGTVTVQLTPRGGFQHLYVVSTSLSQIVIGAADGETIDCFYTIYGERADIDSLVVEKDV